MARPIIQSVQLNQFGQWGVRYLRGDTVCFRPMFAANGTRLMASQGKPTGQQLLDTVREIYGRKLRQSEESFLLDTIPIREG